jgi:hypothetical protein
MSASVGKRPCSAPGHSGPIRESSFTRDDGSREALSNTSYFRPSYLSPESSTDQYSHFHPPRLAV